MTRFSAAVLFVCLLIIGTVSSSMAETETMLSSASVSGSVQEALLAESETAPVKEENSTSDSDRLAPWRVAMISAVLPGFGQIYNRAAWKLPIYYGLIGFFGYRAMDFNDKYNDYREKYKADPTSADAEFYQSERNNYQEKRNQQLVWLCITYLAGILDAYVDAHLYGFDKITEQDLNASAPLDDMTPALSLQLKF